VKTVRRNPVTFVLVFLFGSLAIAQARLQPVLRISEGALFAGAEASQASPLAPVPEKTKKKDGSERIFGIFPAFNVSNQLNPDPPWLITQASKARLQNSVPLSTVMLAGNFPLSAFARPNACATIIPVIARSASRRTHSRVNWSTTVKMRNERPSASLSLIKSML